MQGVRCHAFPTRVGDCRDAHGALLGIRYRARNSRRDGGDAYDTTLFSHVLEHLRDPASVLARFCELLAPGGTVIIAVPNVLSWRQRLEFLRGNFRYQAAGVMDDTHLRFFTYFTADEYLLAEAPHLDVVYKGVTGSVPLWLLRRYLLPQRWSERIDAWASRKWPNLFGTLVLIKARKWGGPRDTA